MPWPARRSDSSCRPPAASNTPCPTISVSTRRTIIAAVLCFLVGILAGRLCRQTATPGDVPPAYLPLAAWDGVIDVDSLAVDDTHVRLKVVRVAVEGRKGSEIFAGGSPELQPYRVRLP